MRADRKRRFCAGATIALALSTTTAAFAQTATTEPEVRPREEIQIGISTDLVPLTSNFSGSHIAVFGTIENADRIAQVLNEYAIVVVVRGPEEDIVIRRKERVLGIWVNRSARVYRKVPSFYAIVANRALEAVADAAALREHELGVANLQLNLYSAGAETFIAPAPEFSASLRKTRQERRLFTEDFAAVDLLGSTLFRATVAIPPDVPVGRHTVTAYLFRNGEFITSKAGRFEVAKVGLEKLIFTLAHAYSLWYGVMAVGVALATGWLGSVLFSRR